MDEREQAKALEHLLSQLDNPIRVHGGSSRHRRRVRRRKRTAREDWSEFSTDSIEAASSGSGEDFESTTSEDSDALVTKSRPLDFTESAPTLTLPEYVAPKQVDTLAWHLAQEVASLISPYCNKKRPSCLFVYRHPNFGRSFPPPFGAGMDPSVFAENTAHWVEQETAAFRVSFARRANVFASFQEWSHGDCVVMNDVLTAMSLLGERGDNSPIIIVDSALLLYCKSKWINNAEDIISGMRDAQEFVGQRWSVTDRKPFPVESTDWGTRPCLVNVSRSTCPDTSPLYDRSQDRLTREDRRAALAVWGDRPLPPRTANGPSDDLLFSAAVSNEIPVDYSAIRRLARDLPSGETFVLRAYVVQEVDGSPFAVPARDFVEM